jgi:hypothetical protein
MLSRLIPRNRIARAGLLGCAIALATSTTALSASSPGSVAGTSCTTTLSAGANLSTALNGASAGSVICLSPGTYVGTTWRTHGGTEGSPVTLTSKEPSNPALIEGRFVTDGSASWVNITNLRFAHASSSEADTVVLGTPHENFTHNDVSGKETICLTGVSYGGSKIEDSHIEYNLVHNCGMEGGTAIPSSCTVTCQGIYMLGGPGDVIANNWCWETAARCYQIRGETDGIWRNNVAADTTQGFIFGDMTPTGNQVEANIVGVTKEQSAYTYGSVGSGNTFANNCVGKSFTENDGVSLSSNTVVAVQFVNEAAHDYELSSASVNGPCRAYGVQGGRPGPGATQEEPSTTTTGTTTTETTPPPPPPPPPPPASLPVAPTGLTAVSSGGSTPAITVHWSPSASTEKITSYSLFRAGDENIEGHGPGQAWATTTEPTLVNRMLVRAKDWLCYRVSATNAEGEGPKSAPVCVVA